MLFLHYFFILLNAKIVCQYIYHMSLLTKEIFTMFILLLKHTVFFFQQTLVS